MSKRSPIMTSGDASNSFKSKISGSLPLLGFLNNVDKVDIWQFWKTVSSAVKIAVNGRGDIFETHKRSLRATKVAGDKQMEEHHLQQLDTSAITIYVPVKCMEKGCRRFRVLKLANQHKIADYFETIHVDSNESSSDTAVGDNELQYYDFVQLCNSGVESSVSDAGGKMTAEQVSCADGEVQSADEDLQAVANFLKANEKQQKPDLAVGNPNVSPHAKSEKLKPLKKIWPVGRPTTRSSSGARVIKDRPLERDVRNQRVRENRTSVNESNIPDIKSHLDGNDLSVDTLTFYPSVKQEALEDTEDFNITIVPVGNSVMHIAHNSVSADSSEHLVVVKSETSEPACAPSDQSFSQNILPNEAIPYRVHISLPVVECDTQSQEVIKEYSIQEDVQNPLAGQDCGQEFEASEVVTATESIDESSSKHELAHHHVKPRNASDIETIISALEEELKKTGSEIAAISVTSNHGSAEEMPTSVEEVNVGDIQASYVDSSGQTVHILQGQEIVEVQQVDNVIWTSDGEVQIVEPGHMLEDAVVCEGHPEQAQYDVVEYEVLADKKQKRGRKRKFKGEPANEKESLVDRTCPMCHRVLNYASSMTAHMRIHTGIRPYSCGQCDRKFTTKANRDRHEATHVGLKPFQCLQCSKSFTEKRSLKIHMRTHTGERPFVCDVCGQSFTQKCTLVVHMDRHTNKKGHLCDLCGKAFRQKCQLDVHVKRHNRQALYPCNECSTKCYTKGDLLRHMIKHTGERPFRCKLCPRAFTRKQYLMDHENQHYGRKPYRCSVCSANFYDMGSCHRHLKKHKVEDDGENNQGSHSAMISSSDFHRILDGTHIGQIIKLDDGSDALVKAVVSEADGSTVYHITCLGKSDRKESKSSEASEELSSSSPTPHVSDMKEEALNTDS